MSPVQIPINTASHKYIAMKITMNFSQINLYTLYEKLNTDIYDQNYVHTTDLQNKFPKNKK